MKNYKTVVLLMLVSFIATSCFEDTDDNEISASSINDFIWKGMNIYYLYKDDVPDLADNRFSNNEEYGAYLNSFSEPEDLFENLVYNKETVDRFSWIVDDYIALEQLFDGIVTSNGMEYQTFKLTSAGNNRYGVVTHVFPNTSAEAQGVKRGDIFYGVNGSQLYYNSSIDTNYSLLNQDTYTINIGVLNDNDTPETDDDFVTSSNENITLSKSQFTENPILINKVLDVGGKKVAYLMYNGFTGTDEFNADLNTVFGSFKSDNATELVLDLRYNSGGAVKTAIILSSLITGQFTGEIFSTEQWNSAFQDAFTNEDPELLINRFINNNDGATLNSLNLSRLYVLTTRRSASASELVISSLSPYIDVIQIGDTTAGKYQASTTLYDSDNFRRQGANPSHTYAMQPLIFKSLNVEGFTDYFTGLTPKNENNIIEESVYNLGVLGDVNEPFLAIAIANITGTTKPSNQKKHTVEMFDTAERRSPFEGGMYIEKELPQKLIKKILFE
jgi:C-terminal processing protease CtpA/Prc